MTQEDLDQILDACKPTPVMFISGGIQIGGDPQENANRAWAKLGEKMGFDPMTVRPLAGKSTRFFTAVPSETPEQKTEREKREKKEKREKEKARLAGIMQEAEGGIKAIEAEEDKEKEGAK